MITRTQVECFSCQEWYTIYGDLMPTGWYTLTKAGFKEQDYGFCSLDCVAQLLKKWGYPNVNAVVKDTEES